MKNSVARIDCDVSFAENVTKRLPQKYNNSVVPCMQFHENTGGNDKNKWKGGWYEIEHVNMDASELVTDTKWWNYGLEVLQAPKLGHCH